MYIYYNEDTDYLEVLYSKSTNYGEVSKNGVVVFKSERSQKNVGYGIEGVSNRIEELNNFFSPYEILSILIKIARIKSGLTQQQMADKMGIKLLPYQRLESGKNNPTLKTILKLKEVLPEIDLSSVA